MDASLTGTVITKNQTVCERDGFKEVVNKSADCHLLVEKMGKSRPLGRRRLAAKWPAKLLPHTSTSMGTQVPP